MTPIGPHDVLTTAHTDTRVDYLTAQFKMLLLQALHLLSPLVICLEKNTRLLKLLSKRHLLDMPENWRASMWLLWGALLIFLEKLGSSLGLSLLFCKITAFLLLTIRLIFLHVSLQRSWCSFVNCA